MTQQLVEFAKQAGIIGQSEEALAPPVLKFAELIIRECGKMNKTLSYELLGVIIDVEEGAGFDEVCLRTVHRVHGELATATKLKEHFGAE